MRILQAVTLFSPDGAYGGPVRVALNQSAALRELGHDVTVSAGVRGYESIPVEQEGVPLALSNARSLVPGVGFAGLTAPGLLRWLWQRRRDFDVVHLHLARDLVLLPLALLVRLLGIPYVVQPHGMLAPKSNALAPILDLLFVRRLLRGAAEVFYLTELERADLTTIAGGAVRLTALSNGVPAYEPVEESGEVPEVLYLARLHERKRPLDFVRAANALLADGIDARFALVGPDEGEGEAVSALIAHTHAITWEGAIASGAGPERMRSASVYVLPSVNEPYPMSVLEAMAVGLPVVITHDCGLADFVTRTDSGIVCDPGAEPIAAAVATLVRDRVGARAAGARGRAAVRKELGMPSISDQLQRSYRHAIEGS